MHEKKKIQEFKSEELNDRRVILTEKNKYKGPKNVKYKEQDIDVLDEDDEDDTIFKDDDNIFKNNESDHLDKYLNDDIEIFDDTLSVILQEFEHNFPDTDGVLGINQVNIHDIHKVDAAFGVIGRKYAERFPDKKVWAPCYNRFFCDFELWQYAKSIGKFVFCRQAQLNHYHPSLNRDWEDSTHNEVRKYLRQDKLTFQKRQAAGLLWGKTYELLK